MLDPEVILGIVDNTIQKNAVFGDVLTTETKAMLIKNSLIRFVGAGEILCRQDHSDNALFLIVDGEVEVSADTNGATTTLGKLGAGELIGEISALLQIPRIATVTVVRPSAILEIPCEIFLGLLSENPAVRDAVNKRSRNRIIETTLRCVPIFNDLRTQSFSELCYLSALKKAAKGDVIVREGGTERSMYVISSGTARVFITVNGKEINIALLRPGDYFGEYSMLTGKPRTASVSALTDLQLVLLEGEAFESFMEYYNNVENQIKLHSAHRRQALDHMHDGLKARQNAETRLGDLQRLQGGSAQPN
jgi:CRP-like cAMP-binding protein